MSNQTDIPLSSPWLRLSDAADRLGVSANTLRRWSDAGHVPCFRSPGGHRRYQLRDIDNLLRAAARPAASALGALSPSAAETSLTASASPSPLLDEGGHDGRIRAGQLQNLAVSTASGLNLPVAVIAWLIDDTTAAIVATHPAGIAPLGLLNGDVVTVRQIPLAEMVLALDRIVAIDDLAVSNELNHRDYDYFHRVLGVRSAITAPLHDGHRPRGVLLAASPSSAHRFTSADVAFIGHLATQAAHACLTSPVAGHGGHAPDVVVRPHRPIAPDMRRASAPQRSVTAADSNGGQTVADFASREPVPTNGHNGDLPGCLRAACALLGARAAVIVHEHGAAELRTTPIVALEPAADAAAAAALAAVVDGLDATGLHGMAPATVIPAPGSDASALVVPLRRDGSNRGHLLLTPAPDAGVGKAAAHSVGELISALLAAGETAQVAATRSAELEAVIEATVQDRQLLGYSAILHATAKRLSALAKAPVVDLYAVEGDIIRALVSYDSGRIDPDWEGVTLPLDRYPCSRTAVSTGHVACATSLDDPVLTPEGRSSLEKWGYQAQLSVPLMACGKVIGLAELSDYVPRDFRAEIDVVQRLADLAGQTLENAALFDQIERHSRLARELAELGSVADGSHDECHLAAAFARRLRTVLDVARCDVFALRDGDLHRLARCDGDEPSHVSPDRPIPLTDCPSTEQALRTNRLLLVSDPSDRRLSVAEREAFAISGYRSEAVIPLYVAGRPYGLIDLLDTRPRDHAEHADFLRSAGQTLQAALDQLALLEQLERRSSILRDVVELGALAADLHEADIGQLLGAVAKRLMSTVAVSCCDIFTMEGDGLRCRMSLDERGFDDDVVGNFLPLGKYPTTAAALRSGEPFVIASLDDPRLTDEELECYAEYGFQSEMGIPLVASERVVGFLDLFDTSPRDFAEHLDFARSVGQIVAGSLDNALLLERLNRSLREQKLLVGSALAFGASLDVAKVLRTVALRACELGEADMCEIVAVENALVRILVSVSDGDDTGTAGATYPLHDLNLIARTVTTGQPQWRHDIDQDPGASDLERAEWRHWGMRASVNVPLLVRAAAIGVVSLLYRSPQEPRHVELLQGLAQVAAQALANADLYGEIEASKQQAERLNTLARRITASLDAGEISQAAMDELGGLLDFDVAVVALVDEGEASFTHVSPRLEGDFADVALDLKELASLSAASTSGARRLSPIDHEAFLKRHPALRQIRSVAAVSLKDAERPIGTLLAATQRADAFSDRDLTVLERVGTHVGIALTNARLYSSIKRLHLGNLRALSSALSAKDHYTLGHAARVAGYMVLLGRRLGWPQSLVDQIEEAAYLHDVGKIGISDRVLLTAAPLNEREWELMRQHPVISADILEPLFDEDLVAGVRHHHERYDGSGYPFGLSGEQIPEIARAMCVVDAYDAMSYRRPYRDPFTYLECRAELERCSGTHFDPLMVQAFLQVLDRLDTLRSEARTVAAQAAARISAEDHEKVAAAMSADLPEYRRIAAILAEVLRDNPGARFLCTMAPVEDQFAIVVDPTTQEDEAEWSPPGEPVAGAGELAADFAGAPLDQNVLYVDRFGVWVYGTAPIRDALGNIVALASADMPPESRPNESHGAASGVKESFASMLHTTAEQLGRARLDAITDHLTGLYNHRYLHERLQEEMERAREAGTPLSLLFLDIDQFKDFNDRYGHSLGDAALRTVAAAIDRSIRRVDLAARYGGEEFVVVLVDTDGPGALEAAERVRSAIADAEVATDVRGISASVGVATFPDDAEHKEELIDKADWAMYMAKRSGRNRVSAFSSGQLRLDLGDATAGRTA